MKFLDRLKSWWKSLDEMTLKQRVSSLIGMLVAITLVGILTVFFVSSSFIVVTAGAQLVLAYIIFVCIVLDIIVLLSLLCLFLDHLVNNKLEKS